MSFLDLRVRNSSLSSSHGSSTDDDDDDDDDDGNDESVHQSWLQQRIAGTWGGNYCVW